MRILLKSNELDAVGFGQSQNDQTMTKCVKGIWSIFGQNVNDQIKLTLTILLLVIYILVLGIWLMSLGVLGI